MKRCNFFRRTPLVRPNVLKYTIDMIIKNIFTERHCAQSPKKALARVSKITVRN